MARVDRARRRRSTVPQKPRETLKRMNHTIKDATVKRFHDATPNALRSHLDNMV